MTGFFLAVIGAFLVGCSLGPTRDVYDPPRWAVFVCGAVVLLAGIITALYN